MSTNVPEVCRLDTLAAEHGVNRPARYWAQAGRETWFSPLYGEYLTKFVSREDANVERPIVVMATLAPDVLCSVRRKVLYIWDTSLGLLSSKSEFSLNVVSRWSVLLDDKAVGCNWRKCVTRDDDCPAERLEVSFWPAEGRLLDVSDDDSASEYEMPLPAAAAGASRDPAPVLHTDVHSTYRRATSGVAFDVDGAALGQKSRIVGVDGTCWRVEGDGGCRNEELAASWAINVVAGTAHWDLAKDSETTAVERFDTEQTYGGNDSWQNSVDGRLWIFVWSTLGADDQSDFTGDNWKRLVTTDDGKVGVTWCSTSSNWQLLETFRGTTAAAGGAFLSEEPPETVNNLNYKTLLTEF